VAFVVAGIPIYFWRIRGRDQVIKREPGSSRRSWWQFWK
jgi:hypothetical protein